MSGKTPLYSRVLRLRHVNPRGWQRAALADGSVAVAVVLVLADLATAWTLLVLPLAVAAVVKAHDVLAGLLSPEPPAAGAEPVGGDAAAGAGGAPAVTRRVRGGHVAVRPAPRDGDATT